MCGQQLLVYHVIQINILFNIQYSNGEFLIMGDFNCRIEEGQSEFCTFLMSGKTGMLKVIILAMKDLARSKIAMQMEMSC